MEAPTTLKITDKDKKKLNMSSKRTINYQNENTDLCIYYEIDNPIEAGNYKIEIFAEGFRSYVQYLVPRYDTWYIILEGLKLWVRILPIARVSNDEPTM